MRAHPRCTGPLLLLWTVAGGMRSLLSSHSWSQPRLSLPLPSQGMAVSRRRHQTFRLLGLWTSRRLQPLLALATYDLLALLFHTVFHHLLH